ncbi:MAG: nitrogenase iron-molybdenum cofactor biosynthesis protein NifN [Gammaproteobacteria bacterium]
MVTIIRRRKALTVQPLKTSPTVGAALAFLGIHRAIPLLHGSQGCSAFSKIFLIQHFREPMPLHTTAMDQVSTIMGAEDNIVAALATLCAKAAPELIGIPTTGLSETQGSDVERAVKAFRCHYPEWGHVAVVPVSTPDYNGSLESGYARAVQALIENLVPEGMGVHRPKPSGNGRWRINVLAGSLLSPGDVEALQAMIAAFGLEPRVLPDLADALDGHLAAEDFSPTTVGGLPISYLKQLGEAIATLVIGPSLYGAGAYLRARTGVPEYRFEHLLGLDATDQLLLVLRTLSGRAVPERLERHRSQLQDAMLDTHFVLGGRRIALALEPDHLNALSGFLSSVGALTVAAVAPTYAPVLEGAASAAVKLGDLEDLEALARANGAELVIGSSHAVQTAAALGVPLLRAGFPQYDWFGAASRSLIGYRGSQLLLFELANLLNAHRHRGVAPYRSRYAQKPEYQARERSDELAAASAHRG